MCVLLEAVEARLRISGCCFRCVLELWTEWEGLEDKLRLSACRRGGGSSGFSETVTAGRPSSAHRQHIHTQLHMKTRRQAEKKCFTLLYHHKFVDQVRGRISIRLHPAGSLRFLKTFQTFLNLDSWSSKSFFQI